MGRNGTQENKYIVENKKGDRIFEKFRLLYRIRRNVEDVMDRDTGCEVLRVISINLHSYCERETVKP